MANDFITDYLKESLRRSKDQQREYNLAGKINLYIKDPLTREVDVRNVMEKISSTVPPHLLGEIDAIFVGMFDEFEEMQTNAMFKDGAIYLSNDQDDEQDMVDDIIHEIAHSIELPYGHIIYGDGRIQDEFLAKRKKLFEILKEEKLNPNKKLFMDPEYSKELDFYLYEDVGYDRLNFICSSYGLFTSAYSATSLREYFANGFEYFFLDDRQYMSKICPQLYKKIEEIYDDQ